MSSCFYFASPNKRTELQLYKHSLKILAKFLISKVCTSSACFTHTHPLQYPPSTGTEHSGHCTNKWLKNNCKIQTKMWYTVIYKWQYNHYDSIGVHHHVYRIKCHSVFVSSHLGWEWHSYNNSLNQSMYCMSLHTVDSGIRHLPQLIREIVFYVVIIPVVLPNMSILIFIQPRPVCRSYIEPTRRQH